MTLSRRTLARKIKLLEQTFPEYGQIIKVVQKAGTDGKWRHNEYFLFPDLDITTVCQNWHADEPCAKNGTRSESLELDKTSPHANFGTLYNINNNSGEKIKNNLREELELGWSGKGFFFPRTGFQELDKVTGGLRPGLIVIGARTSCFKTTLAVNIAYNLSFSQNKLILFYSLDKPVNGIYKRLVCMNQKITFKDIESAKTQADQEKIIDSIKRLENGRIMVKRLDKLEDIINDITSYAKKSPGVAAVFVDYLTLVRKDKGLKYYDHLTQVSQQLKSVGDELSLPVIALSQLSRPQDPKQIKPTLYELKSCGEIENNAHLVLLLHPLLDKHKLEVEIAKNGDGEKKRVILDLEEKYFLIH